MNSPPVKRKLSPLRRVVLLAGGGLLLGLFVVTFADVIPRPVDLTVHLVDEGARRSPSRAIITNRGEGETVFEAQSQPQRSDQPLRFHVWLAPQPHHLEFRVRGCHPQERSFEPGQIDHLSLRYRCDGGADRER